MLKKQLLSVLISCGLVGTAHAADLAVSRFQVVDPSGDIYRGAEVTFEVDVDNNDLTSVTDAELVIDVPSTMIVTSANLPAACSASGPTAPQTLTCSLPTLTRDGSNPDHTFTFVATAQTADAQPGIVTVSSPTNVDNNASNDSLTLTPTVGSGADVALVLTSSTSSLPSSGQYSYFANVTNNGPDSVSGVQVEFALPPSADFDYVSASGTNWSCVQSGGGSQTVTCDYSGSAVASSASFPQITVTGNADIESGTLSAQADIEVTEVGLGDPNLSNNVDGPVVVMITPGTDLEARVQIASSFITGDTGTLTLSIDNNGPTDIGAGAQIVHVLSSDLALDGPLPTGCVESGGTITCTAGSLNSGDTEDFVINISAQNDTGGNQTINATVSPPAGIDDPVSGNDTGSDTFRIDDPAADIFLQSKTKTPNPVQAGQNMTSTIRVENGGPSVLDWSPANPIVITDDLGADETFVSVTTANWNCTTGASPAAGYTTRVTCTTTDSGSVAVDARKTLQILTQAGAAADSDITNNACIDASSLAIGDPNSGNNCRSRTSRATTRTGNLSIQAEVSTSSGSGFVDTASPNSPLTVSDTTTSHFIRLTVSNAAGSDTARTVNIRTNDLAQWMDNTVGFNGGSVSHETSVSLFSADPSVSCSTLATSNDDIRCEATDLAGGDSVSLILQVDRPILSGIRSSTFTVSSPDTIESNTSDDSDVARIDAEPIADLIVNDKRVSPNPPQSGGEASYLVDIKNIGPNTGDAVASADFIDPALFDVLSVTTTAPLGSCDYDVTTADTATCSLGDVDRGETFQMAITVRPRFPFNGASNPGDYPTSHTNTATVTTTTTESDPTTNNSRSLTHDIDAPSLDMRVTNAEPSGFTEPAIFGSPLLYEIQTRNGGLTRGTGIVTTVTPNPPAGYEMAYDAASSTLPVGVSCSQASNTDPVICTYPDMDNNDSETVILAFDIVDAGGGAPIAPITFGTTAVVSSDQEAYDTPIGNNTAAQTTTVAPSTDLEVVSKTRVSPAPPNPINISEPVTYDIVFRNNGPSATTQVRVTDTLPSGFERTASAVTFMPSGSATVSGSSCSAGPAVLCVVDGLFPSTGDTVTMRIEVVATFPYTGSTSDPIVNSAAVDVGRDAGGDAISIDEDATNNSASTSDGAILASSISGTVFSDNDRSGGVNAGEGIGSVTLTLTGTDLYGNAISTTVQTQADGTYTFSNLPPSNAAGYTITQTQPSGYFDYQETAGTAAGTVDNGSFGNGASTNAISGIVLGEDVDATGYLFADYAEATVSGAIYSDDNNNGTRNGGEPGISTGFAATPHISLTGTDYAGNAVNLTGNVDGSGAYSFDSLPPSDGSGYTLAQLEEPTGFYDGLEENGSGSVLAGTVNGSEQIAIGVVDPADSLSDRNFGQVEISTISGLVYEDDDGDGTRQGGETGTYAGATLELTGTDDLGRAISCTASSGADGSFSFPVPACDEIRPGTYTITLTDAPGRSASGTTSGTPSGTESTSAISSFTMSPGTTASGYLFGVRSNSIVANDDDFSGAPINGADGGDTATVFTDDRLEMATFADADVIASITDDDGVTGISIDTDGRLTVPAGTPAGTYHIGYQICEAASPTNCDPAIATVLIAPPAIVANDDDFTGTIINGADGGVTATVFTDDRLNGAVFAEADVTPSIVADGGLTGVSINSDGTLNVPAGTPEGTYTVSYQICEVLNPTNCDTATATVRVGAPTITANNDDFTSTPINGADGGQTASVFPDDRLNNIVFADSAVVPTIVSEDGLTGVSINADGTLDVPATTPAGTYNVVYQICEALNPANCDTATAVILIEPPVIVANDDDFSSTPFNGATGGTTGSVFPDDTLNGASFADAEVNVSLVSDDGLTGVAINPDGTLSVPAATPAGTYDVVYQICEAFNPTNCDTAIATIVVEAAPIVANDDDFSSTPINGANGGTTSTVFTDDTLNGSSFAETDVSVSITDNDGLTGVTIGSDGVLTIPAGTPAGTYTLTYQICETLNPTNCDPANVTVIVDAAPIVANDDDYTPTPVNGANGGAVGNVLTDDTLNGNPVNLADVALTVVTADSELEFDPATGDISVPAGTPAGTYTVEYQICENLNPSNCDTAVATILVEAAEIDAEDDDYSATPVNGANGGAVGNVLTDDTLNGNPVNLADIALTVVTADSELEFDPATGDISVPAGTPAGTYTVEYQICENLNPSNCDTAVATILVEAAEINAEDVDYSATPVNGAEGGTLPNVFGDDTLNGAAIDPADVTATITNDGGLTGVAINADGSITVPPGSIAGTYTVEYQICEVLNPTNCDTAIVTITIVTDASVAGTVFLDANGDDTLQSGETLMPGYTVELRSNGNVIATMVTDASGQYGFVDLDPDLTYDVVFIETGSGTVVDTIADIDLIAGEDRTGLDEPIEPSGTVYDIDNNEPVTGGVVTIVDGNGQALPAACFGDASQQGQLTGSEGYYFFDLVPGAAAACPATGGNYRIEVTLPNGLAGVFGATPQDVANGALDPAICPNDALSGPVCEVSDQPTRPDASNMPPFYAEFTTDAGDPEFANNHLPVTTSISLAPLSATKRTLSATASVGSVVVYTITITNPHDVAQLNVDVVDQLPAGLVYIEGSGRVGGIELEPVQEGRTLTWTGQNVPARGSIEITLGVAVGAGVTVGEYVNLAYAGNGPQDIRISNIAEATVRITPDEVFDCSEVIGKVFDDKNRNGIQDEDEDGLPGVRLATVKGVLVTTDEFGRYHIACAATPKPGIGSNFIVKLDDRTLPTGYQVTTENPRVMRLTQGKMSQIDFGVGALRPVEFQVRDDAFEGDTVELTDKTKTEIARLAKILAEEASVLTVVLFDDAGTDARIKAIKSAIETEWEDLDPRFELIIEIEAVSSSQNP